MPVAIFCRSISSFSLTLTQPICLTFLARMREATGQQQQQQQWQAKSERGSKTKGERSDARRHVIFLAFVSLIGFLLSLSPSVNTGGIIMNNRMILVCLSVPHSLVVLFRVSLSVCLIPATVAPVPSPSRSMASVCVFVVS